MYDETHAHAHTYKSTMTMDYNNAFETIKFATPSALNAAFCVANRMQFIVIRISKLNIIISEMALNGCYSIGHVSCKNVSKCVQIHVLYSVQVYMFYDLPPILL